MSRKAQTIIANIVEHVLKNSCTCMAEGCNATAINSHLLMRNGVLNYVAENGQLMEMTTPSPYSPQAMDFYTNRFKKIGVKQALSLPLFCSFHDTALFLDIEQQEPNFQNYKHLALYSYRTICAEIRKKEQAREIINRIVSSKSLPEFVPSIYFEHIKMHNDGLSKAIEELKQYNKNLLEDINGSSEHFYLTAVEIPITGLYAAGILNLFSGDDVSCERTLPIFIFQVIPRATSTIVLMGYHKEHNYSQMYYSYIKKWQQASKEEYGCLLTGILILMETWGMSPLLYDKLQPQKIKEYTDLFADSTFWRDLKPTDNINLFEGII